MPEGKLRCAICQHVDRAKIEAQFQAGTSLRRIAEAFPWTSAWSVMRHKAHMEQRPQATAPAAVMHGTPTLEQAIREALAEQVVGNDFIRRPQMMRLARSIVGQAIGGRSAALHLLFARLWPEAKPSVIGELVVANQVNVTRDEGKPLTEAERAHRLVEHLKNIYGVTSLRKTATTDPIDLSN